MTELEKCELAKQKGFTYCPMTGSIMGVRGKVIIRKVKSGYIQTKFRIGDKLHNIYAHRLAWYLHYGKLPVNSIDHIDGNTSNNKINNLRDVTHHQNHFNRTTAKGFYLNKQSNKYISYLRLNGEHIHIGVFATEQEAHSAYLEAKKKYHVIYTNSK